MKIQFFAVIIALANFSCRVQNRANIEYVVYGTYAGECMEHCSLLFKLTNDKLLVDTTNSFFRSFDGSHRGVFQDASLSNIDFINAAKFKNEIPDLLLVSNSRDFGNPDGYDQGGIYVEFKVSDQVKSFYIDTEPDDIPRSLRPYARLIKEEIAKVSVRFYK